MNPKPLKLGAAYHGNRMPHHAREDMRDMMRSGMDLVVHMFSHTDWDRHKNKMKEILDISHEVGLETWVDNWGLSGPPGDKSHFLSYHPEAHQIYSDGAMDPVSWGSQGSRQRIMDCTVNNIRVFLSGAPENVVNP